MLTNTSSFPPLLTESSAMIRDGSPRGSGAADGVMVADPEANVSVLVAWSGFDIVGSTLVEVAIEVKRSEDCVRNVNCDGSGAVENVVVLDVVVNDAESEFESDALALPLSVPELVAIELRPVGNEMMTEDAADETPLETPLVMVEASLVVPLVIWLETALVTPLDTPLVIWLETALVTPLLTSVIVDTPLLI